MTLIVKLRAATLVAAACVLVTQTVSVPIRADGAPQPFSAGNLLVSRSVYEGLPSTVSIGQPLPPLCPAGNAGCTTAIADGTYPGVWANDTVDGSFGVTSPIFLDEMTTTGAIVQSVAVDPTQIVTSFSSKSELALNLSTDETAVTFMGYLGAGVNALDVSNSNTPGVFDGTNPVGTSFYRGVAQMDATGHLYLTKSNAYSGNNGRAAVLAGDASPIYFTVGNSNNGTGTPANVVAAGGLQFLTPSRVPVSAQADPVVQKVGSFSITQVPPNTKLDKAGKDDNYRGIAIAGDTLYITKGSGSNGIDTVYQVGSPGIVPTPGTSWPINVAPGFPTAIAKTAGINNIYPFGLWFANPTTLYVADEGDGVMADAAASPFAGLQKWTFSGGTWHLAYVLRNGLGLGSTYSVPGYPAALDLATAGLRNLTGRVNGDGTATIWAITSTVSLSGDQGADPNRLVSITDNLEFGDAFSAAGEEFTVVRTAANGEVLRGVSFAPRTIPAPTAAVVPAANGFGWNNTPVAVTLKATDDPSGIASLVYSLNGAVSAGPEFVSGTQTSVPISAQGMTTVSFAEQNLVGSQSPSSSLTVNIDSQPPVATVTTSTPVLWPPDGRMVPVVFAGSMTDALSGIDPSSAAFQVVDSYGSVQPSGPIVLRADGSYSLTITLDASRQGNDRAGRSYRVIVTVSDKAGNSAAASTIVTVPHDQG